VRGTLSHTATHATHRAQALHHAALLATHHAEGVFIQVEPHVHACLATVSPAVEKRLDHSITANRYCAPTTQSIRDFKKNSHAVSHHMLHAVSNVRMNA
jgi:hypothetical protein